MPKQGKSFRRRTRKLSTKNIFSKIKAFGDDKNDKKRSNKDLSKILCNSLVHDWNTNFTEQKYETTFPSNLSILKSGAFFKVQKDFFPELFE